MHPQELVGLRYVAAPQAASTSPGAFYFLTVCVAARSSRMQGRATHHGVGVEDAGDDRCNAPRVFGRVPSCGRRDVRRVRQGVCAVCISVTEHTGFTGGVLHTER
jgi:hypothetical protein